MDAAAGETEIIGCYRGFANRPRLTTRGNDEFAGVFRLYTRGAGFIVGKRGAVKGFTQRGRSRRDDG